MSEVSEVPVYFTCRGQIFRGIARFRDTRFPGSWNHISLGGRLLKTGGWDFELAYKELGDDKFELASEQAEDLKAGQSVQVEFIVGEPVTVEPGEYLPAADDRQQGQLFDT